MSLTNRTKAEIIRIAALRGETTRYSGKLKKFFFTKFAPYARAPKRYKTETTIEDRSKRIR